MSSTDLEFRPDFSSSSSKINLSPMPIQTPEPSEPPLLGRIITIQRLNDKEDDDDDDENNNEKTKMKNENRENEKENNENRENEKENENENDDVCRTPTSEGHRIPEIVSCPPAPRKPARRVPSCKRKLTELQFFDVKNREDVDDFFRSISSNNNGSSSSAKRSCCPCK
ncbi:uncharacterized protein LOC133797859 [Humulus lupulus]|uniref:uncharacterized protein LOC133797859 n=1 Tax=Humulus lupulus TaxID=3486 RepID=UPI002B40F229|nr:uncharacterized protein LOC133797859 [Humulus lupulus]